MCGFAGIMVCGEGAVDGSELENMSKAITHRGPDQKGHWIDNRPIIGFAHRRLSIQDLSDAGRQPMISPSGRYVMVFNGEIYNHIELRKVLEIQDGGQSWRGRSDTETLLSCFDSWGIENTLRESVGMFAIAVWDRETRNLFLVRDRLGEKPLYYGWFGGRLLFASELKALIANPSFSGEIDRAALSQFIRNSYILSPQSIYRGVRKVRPGHIIQVSCGRKGEKSICWWSPVEVARNGIDDPFKGSPEEAVDTLERLLGDAVEAQMLSDVPLGAFLSGGIDSSSVVALMQSRSSRPVKTFSIGSDDKRYNEAEHAKQIAGHLGTAHTELYVSQQDALELIPSLVDIYDEPFADSSQIPTLLVSRVARHDVSVSLSGDGGDELFAGYNRHRLAGAFRKYSRILPAAFRRAVSKGVLGASPHHWDRVGELYSRYLRRPLGWSSIGDKIHKIGMVLDSSSVPELYSRLTSRCQRPEELLLYSNTSQGNSKFDWVSEETLSPAEYMMLLDLMGYLPDDVLCKLDRAAMSVSLETRVPLLDHRVVEFAWRLPLELKLRGGVNKWVLRQVLYRHVPRALMDRPKRGFAVPLDSWLRGALREWGEELLGLKRLEQDGYFNPRLVRKLWDDHQAMRRNNSEPLWNILMFNAWLDRYI